jgi:hypothetical protein
MVASLRQSDGHENADRRRPPDCDPGARAPIAHLLYDLNLYDVISPEASEKTKWRKGSAQALEKVRFAEGKTLDFAAPGLDFPSPGLGFFFLKAWIFLPHFAQKENTAAHGTR